MLMLYMAFKSGFSSVLTCRHAQKSNTLHVRDHLEDGKVFVLVDESLVDVLQDGQEGDAGGAPGGEELYQHLVVLTEDLGELLEGVDGGDGGPLVPLAVVLVLSPAALDHVVTPGPEGQQSPVVTLGVTSAPNLP